MFIINPCRDLIAPETIRGYEGLAVANVGDARGRFGCMSYRIKPVAQSMRLLGPALTVQTYRADNLTIHVALDMAREGDVLVVDAGAIPDTGLWGALMTKMALRKKLGGIVIDGGVRDCQELAQLGFPVFSSSISPQGGFKASPGSINVPVSCGGVSVSPGDLVAGDADGVVVVPASHAEEILRKTLAVRKKEQELEERMEKGEKLFDLLKLGDSLSLFGR
mgnify:CR=1 FL=1